MGKKTKPSKKNPLVVGMVHLRALPGTPAYENDFAAILATAIEESEIYLKYGVDAILIENMHDLPYLKRKVGPEIISSMAVIAQEIRKLTPLPIGVQVLAGANEAALSIALAAQLNFIRAEGFVFAHVADEGLIESDAGTLLRYRKQIGADHIGIYTDIKKKHSAHQITNDVSIIDTAHAAHFFKSDGLIITGTSTATTADLQEIKAVKAAVPLPVWVGSGVNLENLEDYYACTDGLIIGSHFKQDGYWANPLDKQRVKTFLKKVKSLRC